MSANRIEPPLPPSRDDDGPAAAMPRVPRLVPRRVRFVLSAPILVREQALLRAIIMRSPDVGDVTHAGMIEAGGDAELLRHWLPTLTGIRDIDSERLHGNDRERLVSFLREAVAAVRQAIDPVSPRSMIVDLAKPVTLPSGGTCAALRLRRPLLSDFEEMNWRGSFESFARGPRGVACDPNFRLVARWAARLAAIDVEIIDRLALGDGARVFNRVAALVCLFESDLIAFN